MVVLLGKFLRKGFYLGVMEKPKKISPNYLIVALKKEINLGIKVKRDHRLLGIKD